jgi:hypothetical protein
VPAAAPVPRGPSVLTLYSAADLLTGPGCPVCRYAAEASDRYLGWFALEGHAQPETITRLCASLGMCARHTRALMGQPGAAIRLTAVYRYIMTAARDRLAGRVTTLAACPACEHDGAACCRALDTLLEGLADGEAMGRCRELGGLCIPHLGEAAAQRQRTVVTWLTETMRETVAARPARPEWLAGTDHDAEVRAVLRQALPATGMPGSGACSACLAAAQSERDSLAQLPGLTGASAGDPDPGLALCAGHLADAAAAAYGGGLRALLAWQAGCLVSAARPRPRPARRATRNPAAWLRTARRRPGHSRECVVCRARSDAAQRALDDLRGDLRASPQASHRPAALCVRHLLILRAADPWAGQATADGAVGRADLLIGELAEAFQLSTWARRHGAPGPESAAWRRAAAFLDGGVFGGCPPRQP